MNLTVIVWVARQEARVEPGLAGWPMVRFVLDAARALEPVHLVLAGPGAEQVCQADWAGVACIPQGNGHPLRPAGQAVAGRAEMVLVLRGDTPLIRPATLRRMVDRHRAEGAAVTLLSSPGESGDLGQAVAVASEMEGVAPARDEPATPAQQASSKVLLFRDDWLWPNVDHLDRDRSPGLRPAADTGGLRSTASEAVSGAVQAASQESGILQPGGELVLSDLVALARQQGETVIALPVADPLEVMGLDDGVKLARAEAEMRRRINERWLLAGVTLVHPEATYIEAGVEIEAGTVVWPNTFLQGQTRIGRGCTIGPGSVIRDSTIGDGCRVELSVVEQAVMEEGSDVGPFGHLRKGAHLGPGAHMGNFGEVKNSYLGAGAKMGHFSYLGDATVGEGANIGAGTITCNYDGQRKHRTVVGKGAFIGSDTMLVAPVEIGEGARTGAGSVVTHDVPPSSVAYGVPARVKSSPDPADLEVE